MVSGVHRAACYKDLESSAYDAIETHLTSGILEKVAQSELNVSRLRQRPDRCLESYFLSSSLSYPVISRTVDTFRHPVDDLRVNDDAWNAAPSHATTGSKHKDIPAMPNCRRKNLPMIVECHPLESSQAAIPSY